MIMKLSQFSILSAVLVFWATATFGQCPTGSVPRNPAPVRPAAPTASRANCLVKVLDQFTLGEEFKRELTLQKGKGYWFAANGCPRMGNIGLYVIDSAGNVLKQASAYAPSLCFWPPATGKYVIKVKALSLMHSHRSGSIDACMSESACR